MRSTIFLILLITFCSFQKAAETDMLVMKAAESQLPIYLAKIQPGNEAAFGFTPDDDLDACTIGKPYRMIVFSKDFYDRRLEDERNYIVIKNEWRAPVTIRDTSRVLLTVAGNPGNYMVTDIGTPVLAKELQQKSRSTVSSDTDQYYILQVPTLLADFFVSEHGNSFIDAQFIPLASAIIAIPALENKTKPSYSLTEVEQMVKETIAAHPEKVKAVEPQKQKPGK